MALLSDSSASLHRPSPQSMTALALTSRPIDSRTSGYDIRVLHLCAEMDGEVHLLVVPLGTTPEGDRTLPTGRVFATTETTAPMQLCGFRPLRHVRTSDDHYLRRSSPRAFDMACRYLAKVVRDRRIDQVVAFGGDVAEVAATFSGWPVVVDLCDSRSLTSRRRLEAQRPPSLPTRAKELIDLHGVEVTESRLPHRFSCLTTVGAPDTLHIQRLSKTICNVVTVPNGVDESLLTPLSEPSKARSVVFWGDLSFEPNQDAIRWFLHEVYRPFLKAEGVRFAVVGPHPPDWLVRAAEMDEAISLRGFVADLREELVRFPIMVNPMRRGSGLKNKVLEAFALGLIVVSTGRGIEAVEGAQDGEHLAVAEDAAGFAKATLAMLAAPERRIVMRDAARALIDQRYRWERIGPLWRAVLEGKATPPQDGA